jgi:ABC-2 type transport system permease protein
MFPIALLPFWTHPVAYLLGPTWGIEAIRAAAGEANISAAFWLDIIMMILITTGYVVLAVYLFKKVETKSRRDGTLVQA